MDFGPILKGFLGPGDLQKVLKPFWLKDFRGQKGLRRFLSSAHCRSAAASANEICLARPCTLQPGAQVDAHLGILASLERSQRTEGDSFRSRKNSGMSALLSARSGAAPTLILKVAIKQLFYCYIENWCGRSPCPRA